MKIVHLDSGDTFRGGQQQVLLLMRALAARGYSQVLVSPGGSALSNEAARAGISVKSIPMKGAARLLGIFRLRNLIQAIRPDILHCHDGRVHGLAYLANRPLGIPLVVARRVAFPLNHNLFSRRKYRASQQRFIAVSNFVRELIIRSGIDGSRVDVVYDGVAPCTSPPPSRSHERAPNESIFRIGAMCALENEKGLDLLIQAIARVRTRAFELQCIIAGTGRKRRTLQNLIQQHRLADVVTITSPPPSADEFVRSLDLFVLPSRAEGLGSILLVAMQAGTPVLASTAGGIPEIVEDGKTGFLFENENLDALSFAIARLAANPDLRNSLLEAARRKVVDQFSIEKMTEATLRTYQLLLDAHKTIP